MSQQKQGSGLRREINSPTINHIQNRLFGGSLTANEIKQFINASYSKNPPSEINGWRLDTDLSRPYAKVYYNGNRATITHMGTQGITDWGNNLIYGLSGETGYKKKQRYKLSGNIS